MYNVRMKISNKQIKEIAAKIKGSYITKSDLLEKLGLEKLPPKAWEEVESSLKEHSIDLIGEGILDEVEIKKDSEYPVNDTDDRTAVQAYLAEIGKYPLLTAQEEKELGEKIAKRNLALNENKNITKAQRTKILRDGLRARNKMAVANLRLVVSIAKIYTGRSKDMSLMDLIQEGTNGLYKAVDKFDPKKGFRFSTYATWWIKQSIIRGLSDKSRTIRIPVHMTETVYRYNKTVSDMEKVLGREPTTEEVSTEMGLDKEKIYTIQSIAQDIVSIEMPLGGGDAGGETLLSETIVDENMDTPEGVADKNMLVGQLDEMLMRLTPREREIINLRSGIGGGTQHSLQQIAGVVGVTRERIRQIEVRALEKLKRMALESRMDTY